MIETKKYMLFVATMIMLITFLPFAYINLPSIIGSYHAWVLLWGLSLLICKPRVFTQKSMLLVIVFGGYLLLALNTFLVSMDDWNRDVVWNDFYSMFVAVSIISYFLYVKDYQGLAKLSKYASFFILTTAFLTILISLIFPSYSRDIATMQFHPDRYTSAEKQMLLNYQRYGAGSRADGFGFVALIPIIFYYYKYKQTFYFAKKWLLLLVFVCIMSLYCMQYATLLIIGCLVFVLSFSSPQKRIKTLIFYFVFMCLFVFIPSTFYSGLIYSISDFLGNGNALSSRFRDLAVYIENGGGELDGNGVSARLDVRYISSIKNFSQNSMFGLYFLQENNSYMKLGEEHLYIMNKLVVTGIVGSLFWISVFYNHIKQTKFLMNSFFRYYYLLIIFSFFLYGLVKVILPRQVWLLVFVVIPGLYYFSLYNQKIFANESK